MPIHEKTLIEPDSLLTTDKLIVDGVDVSGHWNTMILPRHLTDYDTSFQEIIQSYGGGENVHRCWQCGSCTNSCTMYALNTAFNPRYWIYLINLGLTQEILKDKDIIWQCVSCNKCTNICPKYVNPEGVMKALQHWMEDEGHVPLSSATRFDADFTRQCMHHGRIEDTRVLRNFLKDTGQDIGALLRSGWLGVFVKRMSKIGLLVGGRLATFLKRLPIRGPLKMGVALVFTPRTQIWSRTADVLQAYIDEQQAAAKARRAEILARNATH